MKKFLVLVAAVCMAYTTAFAQTVKPFKEGDRAVFLGNSITDGGRYHSFIWLYYMTRFPNMPIRVFNGGIGGDTAYDMNKRLDGDIFSKNPTVLMVTFGMNVMVIMRKNLVNRSIRKASRTSSRWKNVSRNCHILVS